MGLATSGGALVSSTGNAITSIGSDPSTQPLLTHPQLHPQHMPTTKQKGVVICHYCNEPGHKIYVCGAIPSDQRDEIIGKFLAEQVRSFYCSFI